MGSHGVLQCHMRARQALRALFIGLEGRMVQCATGKAVPVPANPAIFFQSGSGSG